MTDAPFARSVSRMRRARSLRLSTLVVIAIAGALVAALLTTGLGRAGPTGRASTIDHGPAQHLVDQVLGRVAPGAQGRIQHGQTLEIVLPPGSGGPARADYTPVWRADLAASELALRLSRLRRWTIPDEQTEPLSSVRHPAEARHLDSLSLRAASQQLDANLRVLRSGLPASAHLQVSSTATIPLAFAHRRFALAVDLRVRSLRALRSHLGDLLLGPGTGLVDPQLLIEGLAVRVTDTLGRFLGAWTTARDGGAIDYGPGGSCLSVTLPFRDAHGRPPAGACHG